MSLKFYEDCKPFVYLKDLEQVWDYVQDFDEAKKAKVMTTAVIYNRDKVVELLLEKGVEFNYDNNQAFHNIVGTKNIVKTLEVLYKKYNMNEGLGVLFMAIHRGLKNNIQIENVTSIVNTIEKGDNVLLINFVNLMPNVLTCAKAVENKQVKSENLDKLEKAMELIVRKMTLEQIEEGLEKINSYRKNDKLLSNYEIVVKNWHLEENLPQKEDAKPRLKI